MNSGNVFHRLSESQKSIRYLEKAHPGTSINIVAGNVRLKGNIDYTALKKSINLFVKKNSSMRLRVVEKDGEAFQHVTDYEAFDIDFFDFSQSGGIKALFDWDEGTTKKPFDIIENQLYYCALFKLSEEEGGFYLKIHHLISDAWTMGLFGKQVIDVYSKLKKGLPVDEEAYPSYIDHVRQEEAYTTSLRFEKDRKYWNEKFDTLPEMTVLKTSKTGEMSIKAKRKTMITPAKFSRKLRQFSKENNLSIFTLFMAALAIYINRVAGYEDMVLGTTILNRVNARDKQTTGMFVSVAAPVRITLENDMDFKTFAGRMLKESTDVLKHQKYPYNYLIRDLKKKHKFSGRLFDIVLSYQNSKLNKDESEEEYVAKWLFSGYQIESLVISINDREEEGNLLIDYDFLTDVFSVKEIEFIHQHILRLLWHGLDNPARSISKLEMISEKEKKTILEDFNNTNADYPRDKTIHQIFEEQVSRTPDNVALVFEDETMTYAELNARANQLARTLRAKGIGPDDVVGLIVDRSFDMIVAILAVIKAGGAYLPIDPNHPAERKQYMLDNSGAKALLTKQAYLADITFNGLVFDLMAEASYASDSSNLEHINKPNDLIYVIYTSGSTGQPKGVMLEHRNLAGLLFNDQFEFDFNASDVWTLFHSYCFDFSVWEMYGALLYGGKLVIITSEVVMDQNLYSELLIKEHVTVLNQTPQSMYNLIDLEMQAEQKQLSIRYVFMGGEALKPSLLKSFKERYPNVAFTNLYGPTESTIFATYKRLLEPEDFNTNLSIIGSVIPLMKVYVLDSHLNLLPFGTPGELYVSGNGVSRGYINNETLTCERFIQNPYDEGMVLYKTGDIVRMMPRGDIIYLGRTDGQVKIRGYRIELGEIENALVKHPQINEAVLMVYESAGGSKLLCAYFKSSVELTSKELSLHLSEFLPDYMIPPVFIKIEEFPMNRSGKIDKTQLPKPNENVERPVAAAPRNIIETKLLAMWQTVLGLDHISVLDNFFFIGGDSLNALKVAALASKHLEVEISPRDLFKYNTIRDLGVYIAGLSKTEYLKIPKVEKAPCYVASSTQKRQYILNMIDNGISYNLPGGLRIDGEVDVDQLQMVFKKIIDRHESLRTSFSLEDGEPVQIIHESVEFCVEQESADESALDKCIQVFVQPFDLSCAPLLRVKLISFSQEKHMLMFDMHHIISDGASINIMVRELVALYRGGEVPQLDVQYKDYSAWHNERLKSEKMRQQESYWLKRFSDEIPMLSLPTDFPRPSVQSYKGARLSCSIDEQLTMRIKDLNAKTGTTLFMLLYSAYSFLLSRYAGQEDIVVGIPVEGRQHEDLHHIIGMFVNTLAIRSYPTGEKTFEKFLNEVREELIEAYEHQEFPFETLVEKIGLKRDASRNPLFDTMFVLQNTDLSALSDIGFSAEFFEYKSNTSKFDLTMEAVDKGETIDYSIEYCTDLFEEDTIKRFSSHYINVLKEVTSNPLKKLKELDVLSEQERHQLLVEFNNTAAEYPKDKTIHQIFEEQVLKTPDNIALIFEDETMTYAELNAKANQLARTLRAKGIGPDDVVGLIIDRSFEMIIAIFAVLKAGGAYMPIDPAYPAGRKAHMLTNSNAKILLAHKESALCFNGSTICLTEEESYSSDCANLDYVNSSSNLAYLIYTSGSTGEPKGVMMEHRNAVGLLFNNQFHFQISSDDVWTLFHSYCFDFSVLEMYGALLRGGKLVVIPSDATKDLTLLHEIVKKEKVTVLCQTPRSAYNFVEIEMQSHQSNLYLRYVIIGGEVLKPKYLAPFKEKYSFTELVNIYGPTETTIYVTKKWIKESADFSTDLINIGPANPLTKIFVLDKYLNLVPLGVCGEIYVFGNGVSRGYINNALLTNEKYVKSPFENEEIMYKTGDYARWLPSGELDYIGRIDNQVKIRGFRIELEEIERALLKHENVDEVIVVVAETSKGDKKLCAYYKSKLELTSKVLSSFIKTSLPVYMIPAFFIKIDTIPLNRNGKLDKSKLPIPFGVGMQSNKILPRSDVEKTIASVWSEVLDISPIGIDDNFFEIGGDSLSAVKIVAKLNINIKLIDFYSYPTIRSIVENVLVNNKKTELLINMSKKYDVNNTNVICIPFGGGSPISYTKISKSAFDKNAGLNIYSVNLPGHDYGTNEEFEQLDNLAKKLAKEIKNNVLGEIIIYGHCAGSGLALATVRELEHIKVNLKAVCIGGIIAPKFIHLYGWFDKPVGFYTDKSIREFLKKAGLSGEMLGNKGYLQHMRQVLRNVKLEYNKYFYMFGKNNYDRINTQLYLVVGDADSATNNYQKKYLLWCRYFKSVKLHVLNNADHFFINTHHNQLVDFFSNI